MLLAKLVSKFTLASFAWNCLSPSKLNFLLTDESGLFLDFSSSLLNDVDFIIALCGLFGALFSFISWFIFLFEYSLEFFVSFSGVFSFLFVIWAASFLFWLKLESLFKIVLASALKFSLIASIFNSFESFLFSIDALLSFSAGLLSLSSANFSFSNDLSVSISSLIESCSISTTSSLSASSLFDSSDGLIESGLFTSVSLFSTLNSSIFNSFFSIIFVWSAIFSKIFSISTLEINSVSTFFSCSSLALSSVCSSSLFLLSILSKTSSIIFSSISDFMLLSKLVSKISFDTSSSLSSFKEFDTDVRLLSFSLLLTSASEISSVCSSFKRSSELFSIVSAFFISFLDSTASLIILFWFWSASLSTFLLRSLETCWNESLISSFKLSWLIISSITSSIKLDSIASSISFKTLLSDNLFSLLSNSFTFELVSFKACSTNFSFVSSKLNNFVIDTKSLVAASTWLFCSWFSVEIGSIKSFSTSLAVIGSFVTISNSGAVVAKLKTSLTWLSSSLISFFSSFLKAGCSNSNSSFNLLPAISLLIEGSSLCSSIFSWSNTSLNEIPLLTASCSSFSILELLSLLFSALALLIWVTSIIIFDSRSTTGWPSLSFSVKSLELLRTNPSL